MKADAGRPRAVRYERFGGVEVLEVVPVPRPEPGPGQVRVRVLATGINPGEGTIRKGELHDKWPSTFPSGQGSDLAGTVDAVGPDVRGFAVGDEVLGFVHDRSSHAEEVLVDAANLVGKPPNVSWEAAGGLFVVGTAAYAALRAVGLRPGETVVIAGAAGGVGSIAIQLAKNIGARVIGVAGESNADWLARRGVIPVVYGAGVTERIRAVSNGEVDAFLDAFGADYVDIALALGVRPARINTIINFAAVEKHGIKAEGNNDAASAEVLGELADMVDKGMLDVPIAKTYPLTEVRAAFRELERRHTRGKIVLKP